MGESAPRHPSRFSKPILALLAEVVAEERRRLGREPHILDPFAGTGLVHTLGTNTVGVEIEPEWAEMHPRTQVGNALQLPFGNGGFDMVITSPVYGNRTSDHHEAKDDSVRRTYRHDLGRPLHPDNAGQLQWGLPYRAFHRVAWREAVRVLRPGNGDLGGVMVVNVSNHIRGGEVMPVVEWHLQTLVHLGLRVVAVRPVKTPRMRFGANRQRVDTEHILIFRRPVLSATPETDGWHDLFDVPPGRSVHDVAVRDEVL